MQPSNIFIEGYFPRLMHRSLYKMHKYALPGGGKVFLGADCRARSRRSNCTSLAKIAAILAAGMAGYDFPSVVDAVECGSRCRHLRVAPPSSWLSPSRSRRCEMPSIIGTWKLVDATARDAAGTARPAPYGGNALGRVTFTAHGRMMSVVCDE